MYVICVYDVYAKRCPKVMKVLRKYLFHVQESVFEGELTHKQCTDLNKELNDIIKDDDEVIMYYTYSNKQLNRMVNGKKQSFKKNILI